MKVFYDNIVFSLQSAGGISRYWVELIKRLVVYNLDSIFIERKNKNIFRGDISILTTVESWIPSSILRYLPLLISLPDRSIFHSSYYRISLSRSVVNITTVHDFTYERYRHGLAKFVHSFQKRIALYFSDGIICVSENTKNDLLAFYPKTNPSKVKVIYNGVGDDFFQLADAENDLNSHFIELAGKEFLLFVGARQGYKNFSYALRLLQNIDGLCLVAVGGGAFNLIERNLMRDINSRVFNYQGLSNHHLNILFNNAFCLLYPSEYEGFGIPILEAMRAGCPVVSTTCSSIPEVAGNCAILVDKVSLDSFAEAILRLRSNKIRSELISCGTAWSHRFSWDKCFSETRSFYVEIWDRKFSKSCPQ